MYSVLKFCFQHSKIHVCMCMQVGAGRCWVGGRLSKGRASSSYPPAYNFCSLSGLLFGSNVTVLLTSRGEHSCSVFFMLRQCKPKERKKDVEGNGKNTFPKQDFDNSLLFLGGSLPPGEQRLICNSKIF